MAGTIAFYVGALLVAFLFSRFFMVILRRWFAGTTLILVGNGASLGLATVIGGFGFAGEMGRSFVPLEAFLVYAPAQIVTVLLDFWRQSRKRKAAEAEASKRQ